MAKRDNNKNTDPLVVVSSFMMLAWIVASPIIVTKLLSSLLNSEWSFSIMIEYLFEPLGGIFTIILILIPVFFVVLFMSKRGGKPLEDDDRGFQASKTGLYGTSGWMDQSEMYTKLEVKDEVEEIDGSILGTTKFGEIVALPPIDKTFLNQHILVFGESGRGKSRGFVRPYIVQAAKRGESMILSDPKGSSDLKNCPTYL